MPSTTLSNLWGIVNGFFGGKEYPEDQIVHDNKTLEAQTQGALLMIGPGIASGGVVTAGAGLNVNISALLALAQSTLYGPVALQTYAPIVRTVPASSTVYVFAAVNVGNGLPDSRETRTPVFPTPTTSTLDGGVLLATVTTDATSVTGIVLAPFSRATRAAIPDTSGATLSAVEAEVNKLKAVMRARGEIA
jgi:hypothetical protein